MSRSVFSEPHQELRAALKAARLEAGLGQAELATRLQKPQSFLSKIERGERTLDVIEFLIVARAIGVDGTEIIRKVATRLPSDARL